MCYNRLKSVQSYLDFGDLGIDDLVHGDEWVGGVLGADAELASLWNERGVRQSSWATWLPPRVVDCLWCWCDVDIKLSFV